MLFEDIYASTQNSSFRYENVYNRLADQHVLYSKPSYVETIARVFFEAGVKAVLGERTQQPVLLKGNKDDKR